MTARHTRIVSLGAILMALAASAPVQVKTAEIDALRARAS